MKGRRRGTLSAMAGRTPDIGENRDQYLRVRLAPFEADAVDVAREGRSRSAYVRDLIEKDARERGLWP